LRRIDALGKTDRSHLFQGATLDDDEDSALQALVQQAAAACGAPIALVSLVLDHVQLFRAQHGLPDDLAASRATDRDLSFCQIVVRDEEPLEIASAAEDVRVPQDLVDRYGIHAYLGVPLRVNDEVVGTLCVLDLEPRGFDDTQRTQLEKLGRAAAARLGELAAVEGPSMKEMAINPAFAELRNALTPVACNVAAMRMTLAQIAPLGRLASAIDSDVNGARALAVLGQSAGAIADLREMLDDLEEANERVCTNINALGAALRGGRGPRLLHEVIEHADQLSLHRTRNVGGVSWPEIPSALSIAAGNDDAVIVLAAWLAALSGAALAARHEDGIAVALHADAQIVRLLVTKPTFDLRVAADALSPLLREHAEIAVSAEGVSLTFEAAPN
jgi:GAF domain